MAMGESPMQTTMYVVDSDADKEIPWRHGPAKALAPSRAGRGLGLHFMGLDRTKIKQLHGPGRA